MLFYVYYPEETKNVNLDNLTIETEEWQYAKKLKYMMVVYHILVPLIGLVFINHLGVYANLLGYFSLVLAIVQYIPQLAKTYKTKQIGALSIPSMVIQVRFVGPLIPQPSS